MKTYSVGSAQILADKVSHDMTVFVKRHVFPDLPQANALNWRDIFVLSQTLRYPEGLTPADISANTRLDPATVLRANEKLYKNRLITILEQARDARSNLVQVTSGGADFLQNLFSVYREKQEKVFLRFLPRLETNDIKEIFETCLNVQEHAEKFASLRPNGKIRHDDRTSYSRHAFQESFEEFQRFPEFILQVYCRRISSDYMFFLKSHAMSKMSDKILRKSRELLTLMTLDYIEHDATAMDVVRLLRFDPATATRAVAILSQEGFIAPANGYRDDDRKKPLILSEKGRNAVAEYKHLMIQASVFSNETLGLKRSQKEINKQLGILAFISNRTEILASIKPGKLV
ncbi:hypothetical protein [Litorimonas sp.]|uniref:hypothetical protein n=1 Tax=Litorimonas sp. TaxID=1892381 RepID=UPI003A88CAF9